MKPLATLVGFIVAVSAQAQTYFVFQDTPKHNEMARTAAQLKAIGWIRNIPDSPFAHPRFLRSVLAQMVVDTLKTLPANLDAERVRLEAQFADPTKMDRIDFLRRDNQFFAKDLIAGLTFWVEEFSSDLGAQEPGVLVNLEESKARAQHLGVTCRKAIELQEATLFRNVPNGEAYFPDVPENHALYRVNSRLKNLGWVDDGVSFLENRSRKRSTFGEITIEAIDALPRNLQRGIAMLKDQIGQHSFSNEARELFEQQNFLESQLMPGLRRWVDEFSPEIVWLESTREALLEKLAACEAARRELVELCREADRIFWNRFPDVPAKHWASWAMKDLRDAGILVGYPDGRFRGGS